MIETLTTWKPRALSVLRIIMGLMIIEHGMGKIFHYPALPAYANIQPLSLLGAAGFIEIGNDDRRAFFREPLRGRASDSRCAAGDDADFSFDIHFPKPPLLN